eukprot:364236-Chlamydomonas_euryale.AAC.3
MLQPPQRQLAALPGWSSEKPLSHPPTTSVGLLWIINGWGAAHIHGLRHRLCIVMARKPAMPVYMGQHVDNVVTRPRRPRQLLLCMPCRALPVGLVLYQLA